MIDPRIYLSPPHVGDHERRLLLEAFDSNWIAPLGPHLDAFEREVAKEVGVGHAAALSSGTAALHLGLHILGVRTGDEVLVPSFTFAATANPVIYCGAQPVFIDCSPDTWNMDPGLLAEELADCDKRGRLPKAVIAVDLYGQCADYDAIAAACAAYDIPLFADAAESLGATYKGRAAGAFGALAAISFNGNKIITTSGGGMLLSDRASIIEKARFLATQARDPAPFYQHSQIGFNYRMSNLLAALGRGQLMHLKDRVARRRANRMFYQERLSPLPGISFPSEAAYGKSNGWLTCCTIDPGRAPLDREMLRQQLESQNIESRPVWKPLHMQPVFSNCRTRGGAQAEKIFAQGLCLPSGSNLTQADLHRVARAVERAWHSKGIGDGN